MEDRLQAIGEQGQVKRLLIPALSLLLVAVALAAGAPDKLPEAPFCDGSDPGYCNPVDPAILRNEPPDLPLPVKLRHQLAKERKEHRAQVRVLRQRIRALEVQ